MTSLSVFRIAGDLDAPPPEALDGVVARALVDASEIHDHVQDGFVARLYVPTTRPTPPKWRPFVEAAFPGVSIGESAMLKALLVVWLQRGGREALFAIPFGHTRHGIDQDRIDPTFGRRTALNLIYQEDEGGEVSGGDRVRQVDARTHEANVRRSRVQRSRDTTFETFGVDPDRDLLDRIVGVPQDVDRFGRRITGGRSIHLSRDLAFDQLPGFLADLDEAHEQTTYKRHFSWVDKVTAVKEQDLIAELKAHVADLVRSGSDEIQLAPPEIIDWERVETFTYDFGNRPEHTDLKVDDYLAAVASSRSKNITPEKLLTHRVVVSDGDGAETYHWQVFRCLSSSFDYKGTHYVLDEGNFFAVAADYLSELKEEVAGIPAPGLALLSSTAEEHEGPYNERLAGDKHLLLDRKLANPVQRTTGIEICDVMTAAGELVHVKRKLGSSDLSHLFAQGYVSAESLNAGPDLRTAIRSRIDEEARDQHRHPEDFTKFATEPFESRELTVVYAILADWKGQAPQDRLPFFSMINLRHYRKLIRSMGFQVAFAAVDAMVVVDPPT
jgi:uncharacterized protein (TIGR04141 family)